MPSILLINLPGESIRAPEEHCGLASLHAYLTSHSFAVEILDAYAFQLSKEETLNKIKKWININKHAGTLFVGISPFVTSHHNFVWIGEHVKNKYPGVQFVAGGHYATLNKEYLLDSLHWLDGIIVGEGEETFLQLVQGKQCPPGYYCRGNKTNFTSRRRIMNLDALPWQTRYLSPVEIKGQPFAITTSRGCYGNCKFCSISSFYKTNLPENVRQTFRSAESVFEEVMLLNKKYGVTSFKIVDDNFFRGNDNTFLDELSRKLSKCNFSFRLSARPNDITEENAQLLSKMGVKIVAIGIESSSQNILTWLNKGITLKDSLNAVECLKKNGITCLANFIMFLPILTLQELEENYKLVKQLSDEAIFHRINSHLWLRKTDPLADDLINCGLCDGTGFPYLCYKYADKTVEKIYNNFTKYCEPNMKQYYNHADKIMANGIQDYPEDYILYKKMLKADLEKLEELIQKAKNE